MKEKNLKNTKKERMRMLSSKELRKMTEDSLKNECNKIVNNYLKVNDEYYSTGSRDSAFLKDLVDSLIGISAVLEVYVGCKGIHPNYAIEKLKYSKGIIDSNIKYFENKLEKEMEK